MDFRRKSLKVRTQYNNFKFSRTFLALVAYYYARRAAIARLPVLKECGKIQNVASSSDFDIFFPEIHPLGLL